MTVKRKALSVQEIKIILLAQCAANRAADKRLQKHLRQAWGEQCSEEESWEETTFINKVNEWLVDVMAPRIKRNRRNIPLISREDTPLLTNRLLELHQQSTGEMLSTENRKDFETALTDACMDATEKTRKYFETINNDPYEAAWQLIRTVQDLADEHCIPPTSLRITTEVSDEITRRIYPSKKRFLTHSKSMLRFLKEELQSLEMSPEDKKEVKKDLRTAREWLLIEANRIYGTRRRKTNK